MNLDPESDIGHIEYKVKIDPQNTERLSHLTTQLLFRITEGNGIALYKIGVTDKGKVCGISKSEMDKSIGYLTQMAKNIKASIISIQYLEVDAASLVSATVVIQLEMAIFEIPVLFLGSGNSGKSSIISYLSHKKLDNGNGKSRIQLFRHKHEFATGKTSCVVPHILNECFTKSSFLISLIDSCGSIKYLHSTYKFLTGSSFNYICLVVDVTVGVDQELKEMIMCVLYFQINCLIVINKIDKAIDTLNVETSRLAKTLKALYANFQGYNLKMVDSNEDMLAPKYHFEKNNIPMFLTSCIDESGFDLLSCFLNTLKPRNSVHSDVEFQIDQVFYLDNIGIIVFGRVLGGSLSIYTKNLYLGPTDDGKYICVSIGSIQRQRINVLTAYGGQSCTLSLPNLSGTDVRKGMMIISNSLVPSSSQLAFTGNMLAVHDLQRKKSNRKTIFLNGTRTNVFFEIKDAISHQTIRKGTSFIAHFQLVKPKYFFPGSRIIYREDKKIKMIGHVL